jgi:hypothetical protein
MTSERTYSYKDAQAWRIIEAERKVAAVLRLAFVWTTYAQPLHCRVPWYLT